MIKRKECFKGSLYLDTAIMRCILGASWCLPQYVPRQDVMTRSGDDIKGHGSQV